MSVVLTCDSCGAEIVERDGEAACYGCSRNICQSCCDVFEHYTKDGGAAGLHGTGDPAQAVEALRRQVAALEQEAAAAREHIPADIQQISDGSLSRDVAILAGQLVAAGDAVAALEQERDALREMFEPQEAADQWPWEKLLRIAQRILDRHYPADIFTGESGDPGPRLVAALRDCLAAHPQEPEQPEPCSVCGGPEHYPTEAEGCSRALVCPHCHGTGHEPQEE